MVFDYAIVEFVEDNPPSIGISPQCWIEIINKINKVQWVDFKLENVLVSLHSLKTMGLGSIIFKE
jgi:hypothetical protein